MLVLFSGWIMGAIMFFVVYAGGAILLKFFTEIGDVDGGYVEFKRRDDMD